MEKQKKIRIGCHSGFWGDSPTAAIQLVKLGGYLDYLVSDYLAEVTMCILAKSKNNPSKGMGQGGFVNEFVDFVWKPLMKEIIEKKIKIITNAGGMNPLALKEKLEKITEEAGLQVPLVAAIIGDDLLNKAENLREKNFLKKFSVNNEEEEFWPKNQPIMSFNAYIGSTPIVHALEKGAQIVIIGRCVDSAIVLGPLIYEFGWKETDYNLLSCGSLAGHIIECGCQSTGGNYTDWEESYARGWDNIGYPIVECYSDGSFVVTKPEKTGGIVTIGTVAEQILYEIGDPSTYILPDVVCDWRDVNITNLTNQKNKVLVTGAKGRPPTNYYKVSVTTLDGFKLSGLLMIGGIDAYKKALAVGESILSKTRKIFKLKGLSDYISTNIEILGAEHTYGPHSKMKDSREVLLRLSVQHSSEKALKILAMEFAPTATSMAPGITGGGEGRPKPTQNIKFYSCLIEKKLVPITIKIGRNSNIYEYTLIIENNSYENNTIPPSLKANLPIPIIENTNKIIVPLINLCYGRSGDKGDVVNIGLISRKPMYYDYLRAIITEKVVSSYLNHLIKGSIKVYELPGIFALNFVITKALGGGGISSLNIDRQGKTYAQLLLTLPIPIPSYWDLFYKSKL